MPAFSRLRLELERRHQQIRGLHQQCRQQPRHDHALRRAHDAPVLVPTTLYQKSTDGCGSGYDGMGRLTNMQQIFSSASDDYSYVYDAAGNITQMSSTADGTETYTYDAANELQSVTSATLPDEGYTYNSNGNRTQTDDNTETCTTGPDNELLFDGTYNYLYDAEGNRTAKFEYWEGADFKGSTVPEGATNITLYTGTIGTA